MDENKKLNILKDRKLDRQEKNKSEGLKKEKEQRFAPTFVNLKSNTMKTQCKGTDISEICKIFSSFYRLKQCYLT